MNLQALESRLIFYDFEVFKHDWLVVFIEYNTGEKVVFHNDNAALLQYMRSKDMIAGSYNGKHYDQYILKGIYSDYEPERIKEINDFIIKHQQQGWMYQYDSRESVPPQLDMMDDIVPRRSLKMLQGFMGMNIVESSVPFDIDRKLTPEELVETEFYCTHDVEALINVYKARRLNYVKIKLDVCEIADVDPIIGVCSTNAKLTAMAYKAEPVSYGDDRDYVYHERIDLTYIPQTIIDFYDQLKDESLTDDDIYHMKLKDTDILGVPHTYAWGGLHGARPKYHDKCDDEYIILNYDFASYYPHLRTKNGYSSRAITDPDLDEVLLNTRLSTKKGTPENTALKLIINICYGATLEQFNKLYDPLMGRSTCITGQLYLTELLYRLDEVIEDFTVVQSNTDGIMFKVKREVINKVRQIVDNFVDKVEIPMGEEVVEMVAQKDVNNYVAVIDGKLKYKGGMTSSYKPDFKNRHLEIVDRALVDYLAYGTDPAETVNSCTDIFAFQMIQKVGPTYDKVVHMSHDEKSYVELQRTNRIYAGRDKTMGKVKKVKIDGKVIKDKVTKEVIGYEDSYTTLPDCPPHALVDNENKMKLINIDRSFYIRLAVKRIKQFKGDAFMSEPKDIMNMDIKKLQKAELLERAMNVETELAALKQGGNESGISAEAWDELQTELRSSNEKYQMRNEAYKELSSAYDKLKASHAESPVSPTASVMPIQKNMTIAAKMFELRRFLQNYEWKLDGYNTQTDNEYITSHQYKTALSRGCQELGLAYNAGLVNHESLEKVLGSGKTMYWSQIEAEPTFTCIESNETETFRVFTEAADTLDKALLKCNTMVAKVLCQTHFLVSDATDGVGDGGKTEEETGKTGYVTPKQAEVIKDKVIDGVQYASDTQVKQIVELIEEFRTLKGKPTYQQKLIDLVESGKCEKAKATTYIMALEEKIDNVKG